MVWNIKRRSLENPFQDQQFKGSLADELQLFTLTDVKKKTSYWVKNVSINVI